MSSLPADKGEVVELGPHERMSVDDALEVAKREQHEKVLILCESENDLFIRSNSMSRAESLWLLEKARLRVLGFRDED